MILRRILIILLARHLHFRVCHTKEGAILPGLDGRKMSKSYGNVIPLFAEQEKLRKLIFKIKTDSSLPNEPKELETLFTIYKNLQRKMKCSQCVKNMKLALDGAM